MTRKDFEVVAELLGQALTEAGCTEAEAARIAQKVAGIHLASLNPRFDMGRFIDAVCENHDTH